MFEKVNPSHPDKVADRIAGAIVDLCYTKNHDPKVACEVLIGHGEAGIQVETSEQISAEDIEAVHLDGLRRQL
jgi:S-adenosylmethionine synthetase